MPGGYRVMVFCVSVLLGLPVALSVLWLAGVEDVLWRVTIGLVVTLLAGRVLAWVTVPPPNMDDRRYGPERYKPGFTPIEHGDPRPYVGVVVVFVLFAVVALACAILLKAGVGGQAIAVLLAGLAVFAGLDLMALALTANGRGPRKVRKSDSRSGVG
ncbi:MAG: hypothetical protein JJU33_11095 [Phycisphaerales bacterium]|nr:hypothetical protein [Phycisphaerales bacterium]